jgi:hypothetical protein
MAEDGSMGKVDAEGKVVIELANADEVRDYIRRLQMAIDDLEDLLHEAPPLRFAPKQTIKADGA